MAKRNSLLRRSEIVDCLKSQGQVSVEDLAQLFSTSEVTIRKDLSELEMQGLLIRRFGGAVLPSSVMTRGNEGAVPADRQDKQKCAIAAAAAKLVLDNSRIVIDSGRTTSLLLPHLEEKTGLVVMTNSLAAAQNLTELKSPPTVLMPGGTWDRKSRSFQGQLAQQMLQAYDFDQLYIGADGLDVNRGSTTFNELVNLSQVMADVSKQVIVMAESWKVGRKMPNLELSWQKIDVLITDSGLTEAFKSIVEQLGVEIILV